MVFSAMVRRSRMPKWFIPTSGWWYSNHWEWLAVFKRMDEETMEDLHIHGGVVQQVTCMGNVYMHGGVVNTMEVQGDCKQRGGVIKAHSSSREHRPHISSRSQR